MRHPIAHYTWYAMLAGLAVLAVGTGLDRQSRRDRELSARVPGPFRGFAQENVTLNAVMADDPDRALVEAETLVRRRPIPAENLFLLAIAQEKAGRPAAGAETLELAALRGWRMPQIQMLMIENALRSGNSRVAAARLLALWSIGAEPEMLQSATRQVLDAPGGPQAFGAVLAKSRFTKDAVLRRSLNYTSPSAFVEMIAAARTAGAVIDCSRLRPLAADLIKKHRRQESTQLLGPHCSLDN